MTISDGTWMGASLPERALAGLRTVASMLKPHPPLSVTLEDAFDRSPLAPEQLRDDLKCLRQTMVDVGVKPFAYASQSDWEAHYFQMLASLEGPLDRYTFYLTAAPLFARLNDGHVSLTISELYSAYLNEAGPRFPLEVIFRDACMYVRKSAVENVQVGAKIAAINGEPAERIIGAVIDLTGGQKRSLRVAFGGARLHAYLFARDGRRDYYDVAFTSDQVSRPGRLRVPTLTQDQIDAAQESQNEKDPYAFSRLAMGRVGYLEYRECTDARRFNEFLRHTFRSIRQAPIDGLIIDIRDNTGGGSSLNNDLWSYVTTSKFAQFGATLVKVNDRLKYEFGLLKYAMIYSGNLPGFIKMLHQPNGRIVEFPGAPPKAPSHNPLRYAGPVFLLIGEHTFSSALGCAIAAKEYGLATIVGEETGEPVNTTGEVYSGITQHSKIGFRFTTKYFTGPKNRPDGQGVVPDVCIAPTENDIMKRRDPVLDYAVRQIIQPQ